MSASQNCFPNDFQACRRDPLISSSLSVSPSASEIRTSSFAGLKVRIVAGVFVSARNRNVFIERFLCMHVYKSDRGPV